MKKVFLSASLLVVLLTAHGQNTPQLGKDPIDKVIAAMTTEEKVSLLIGTGMPGFGGQSAVVGSTQSIVPGAAGTTFPIERLGIPAVVGPAGLRISPTREGTESTYYCTAFPVATLLASTWNTDLVNQVGQAMGQEVKEYGCDVLLAPALNIHRSPLCGRNFEYYSEDSVLAGYIGASSIAGAQSYGVYAYMKHFALNDQQINQSEMLCTWADEQAIREIYLRPFEISAKVGGCKAVMSSWNYIGNQWTGACNALLNGVLRGEWGFRGMVITDGFHFTDYMDSDIAIRNGCDLMLKNYDVATNHLTDTTSATSVKAMRQACKNIMYTVVNSRVYDPANTVSTPIWRTAMIVVNVLLAVLLVVLEVLTFKSYKKKKAQ